MTQRVVDALRKFTGLARQSIRIERKRHLYWSVYEPRNFGDWIGPYLFQKLTGRTPVFRHPSDRAMTTVYVTVGSIARRIKENSIVWGSGVMSRQDTFSRPRNTLAVRGPYT